MGTSKTSWAHLVESSKKGKPGKKPRSKTNPVYHKNKTTTQMKDTTMQGQGSKSGGFHVGGCGHRGKIEVWRHGGRAFYAAGSQIHLNDDIAAVIDMANSATKELKRWEAPPADKPPTPPERIVLVDRAKSFLKDLVDKDWLERVLGRLTAAQTAADLEWEARAAAEYEEWMAQQAKKPPVQAEYQTPKPVYIPLDWPDYQAPTKVGLSFWQALWAELPEGTPEQPAKIVVCCMGGHGRTGTCLAALMIVGGGLSANNAVNTVRYQHCVSAVESDTQIQYLKALAKKAGTDTQPLDVALADKLDGLAQSVDTSTATATGTGKAGATKANLPLLNSPADDHTLPLHDPAPQSQQLSGPGAAKIRLSDVPSASKVLIQDPAGPGYIWAAVADYQKQVHGPMPDLVFGVAFD